MFPLPKKCGIQKIVKKMSGLKFKDLSEMKEETQKLMNYSFDDVSLNIETYQDRIKELKFSIEYHSEKVVRSKLELEYILSVIESKMAESITPINEPINIAPNVEGN